MSGLPAKCRRCGHEWRSRAIVLMGVESARVSGNMTNCPRCGGSADIASGTFTFDDAGQPSIVSAAPQTHALFGRLYRVLRDKSVTQEDIEALAALAAQVKAGQLTAEQASESAKAVNSKFASLFIGQESGWLAVILTIVLFFMARGDSDADHAEVMEALRTAQATAERQLELDAGQLEQLKRIAETKSSEQSPAIKAPPPGPRTKRQQRRDRRFGGQQSKKAPPPKNGEGAF